MALTLVSLSGSFGGGSYGLASLVGGEKIQEIKVISSGKEEVNSAGSSTTKEMKKKDTELNSELTQKEDKFASEIFYKDEEGKNYSICEKREKDQWNTNTKYGYECQVWFSGIWKNNELGNKEKPEIFLNISKKNAFDALWYYFGNSSPNIKNISNFVDSLGKGLNLGSNFCRSEKEDGNGNIIAFCNSISAVSGDKLTKN
ncbi:hypothetical protein [Mycoplasma suis]|nr:hypothetical protein [Mycoplasma suis]